MTILKKNADERLDWDFDYSVWLIDDDVLAGADVTPDDGITATATIESEGQVKLWLVGGVIGKTYRVRMKISTLEGRIRNECIKVRIK